MIPQSFIEEVQKRTDLAELIASYIPLKKRGRNLKALCPFHHEKTPSFFVSPEKQIFHCFGCGQGGGAIQFLMLYEKVNFPEAVEILAKRLGLSIPYKKEEKNKLNLYEAVSEACSFFHKTLLEDKSAEGVRIYLKERGIDLETIRHFRIGYASGRNTLLDYLRKKGFTLEVLEKASLIVAKEEGFRDLFWDRIIFPIFDVRARVIAFGARLWKDVESAPKYINSLEGPLYSKREHLFGLHLTKEEIVKKDSAVVVEGYLDMIIPYMRGITNIVASLGTALTLEQIQLIKRYTSNIFLVFDSDKAGELATLRALDLLLENNLNVEILTLPEGYDPDALVRKKGKGFFLELLSKKIDFFDYKLNFLKRSYNLESIEGKTKVATQMLSTINKLKSEVEKYEYIKRLAEVLKIKEEILLSEARQLSKRDDFSFQSNTNRLINAQTVLPLAEKIIFKFMLNHERAFLLVKRNLKEEDFISPLGRRIINCLFQNLSLEKGISCAKTINGIEDKEINSVLSRILIDEDIPEDKELFKSSLSKLLQNRTKNLKEKLKAEIKEAERIGDKERLKILLTQFDKVQSRK